MSESLRLTIGTAGHVDHGKTSLVRALTGIDTDRWEEEKRRGMTIDLGFAHLDLPDGRRAGLVDVPGHERFLRNMLAGASGLDLVLLVVAADDGVMPQTREHLDILELLDVRSGLVVLSKTDLVDADLLALAEADVREALAGSFLDGAPLLPVSTVTGEGLDALRRAIVELTAHLAPRPTTAPPRMAVDRVFVRPGFGTVVTGTMLAGEWHEGDKVEVWPGGETARIRGLQVHGDKVATAAAGQRVALNLAGIERADLGRGAAVGAPGILRSSTRLAVELRLLAGHDVPLKHRDRVRVHLGTAEVMGRVVLLDADGLAPGTAGMALIELEAPLAADFADHFVIRRFSPLLTLGGGRVLQPDAPRYRRRHADSLAELQAYAAGDWAGVLAAMLRKAAAPVGREALLAGLPVEAAAAWDALVAAGDCVPVGGSGFAHVERLEAWQSQLLAAAGAFVRQHPWRLGAPREAVIAATRMPAALVDHLVERLEADQRVRRAGTLVLPAGHEPDTLALGADTAAMQARLAADGLVDADDLRRDYPKLADRLADYLADRAQCGLLIAISRDIYATPQAWERLIVALRQGFSTSFTASQAREVLGLSRRFAIPLLEYCDRQGITRRQGDLRTVV